MKSRSLLLLIYIGLLNCSSFKGETVSWYTLPEPRFEIPPYAKHLAGLKFCLDPGHGGDAHIPNYKRGPTGVREATVNLRVANLLKGFLEASGAEVIMTRNFDSLVSLEDRAEFSNSSDVHFFVSLHHNASNNPQTNYTSTWYHADADHSPAMT